MGQIPACRTTVGDRGPAERTATRHSRSMRDPATSGRRPSRRPRRPRGPRPGSLLGGLLLAPLFLAPTGCGPDGGQAMLGDGQPMLDGAPTSGRRTSATGAASDSAMAAMVETLARDRELISRGVSGGDTATPASASADVVPAPAARPRVAAEPPAATMPPPRWNQGAADDRTAAATRSARDLSYDIEPPSLSATGERRRPATTPTADDRDDRDAASRLAGAFVDMMAEERGGDSPWLDDADRSRTPPADRPSARERGVPRSNASLASPERTLPAERVAVARADLMLALMVDAIDHPDRALSNALLAALGTVGDPDATIDPSMFRQVADADRDLVDAFVAFAKGITPAVVPDAGAGLMLDGADDVDQPTNRSADDASATVDRDALLAAIDQLRARVARTPQLAIQRAALCRRVDGFGVFEPMAIPHRFLAGSPNAFIVYVEVDEFHSEQRDGRDWVTELDQRVQIYNDRDARPVWATEWSEVVDVNANRRRDFFTAQIIELPDAFSLGVFHLKIQMRDTLTGAEAETSIEFEMVAGGSGLPIR